MTADTLELPTGATPHAAAHEAPQRTHEPLHDAGCGASQVNLLTLYRESGIGGEDGRWGLLRYTQVKTAYHHYGR